jgi:hypothetical protein
MKNACRSAAVTLVYVKASVRKTANEYSSSFEVSAFQQDQERRYRPMVKRFGVRGRQLNGE